MKPIQIHHSKLWAPEQITLARGFTPEKLVALDRQTLIPIEVHWRYENETESKTGKYFSDTDPNQRIIATLGSENITLNIANISSDCTSIVAIKTTVKPPPM